MKTTITTVVAMLFAVSGSAADVYHGLAEGNSDLSPPSFGSDSFSGVQPSVGDSLDRYDGFSDDNPDLFQSVGRLSDDTRNSSDDGQVTYVGPGLTL